MLAQTRHLSWQLLLVLALAAALVTAAVVAHSVMQPAPLPHHATAGAGDFIGGHGATASGGGGFIGGSGAIASAGSGFGGGSSIIPDPADGGFGH